MRQILQNKPIYYHISTKSNEQILFYNKDYILFNNSGGGNCLYFAFLTLHTMVPMGIYRYCVRKQIGG